MAMQVRGWRLCFVSGSPSTSNRQDGALRDGNIQDGKRGRTIVVTQKMAQMGKHKMKRELKSIGVEPANIDKVARTIKAVSDQ